MKYDIKHWFDIGVLNAIRNRDKHYKTFKQSVKNTDKENLKYAKLSPQKY